MTFEDQYSEFLEHYGVIGMRWGVRRSNRGLGRAASKTRRSIKSANRKEQSRLKSEQQVHEKLGNKKAAKNSKIDMKISTLKKRRDILQSDIDLIKKYASSDNPLAKMVEGKDSFIEKQMTKVEKTQTKIDRLERRYR